MPSLQSTWNDLQASIFHIWIINGKPSSNNRTLYTPVPVEVNHMLASNTSTPIQCFEIYLYFKYLVIFKHFNIMFCIYDVLFSSNMKRLKNPAIRNILKSLENTLIEKLTICNRNDINYIGSSTSFNRSLVDI